MSLRIYISGPMRGVDDFEERFKKAEKYLSSLGTYNGRNIVIINPCEIEHRDTNDRFQTLKEDFIAMDHCNAIYFLKGWEKAGGCMAEWGYAIGTGMYIFKEGTGDIELVIETHTIFSNKWNEVFIPQKEGETNG